MAEIKLYEAIAQRYKQKYDALEKRAHDDSCFKDIAGNLVGGLRSCITGLVKYSDSDFDWKKSFMIDLKASRDYFKLLEKHEQFCLDELSKKEGHFPDLRELAYSQESKAEKRKLFGPSGSTHNYYVHLVKKRLNGDK